MKIIQHQEVRFYAKYCVVKKGRKKQQKKVLGISQNPCQHWLRGLDLNQRPSGYEPDELSDAPAPRRPSPSQIVPLTWRFGGARSASMPTHHRL